MSTDLLDRPELALPPPLEEPQPQHDHRFFDPEAPRLPREVAGVDTDDILRLGRAVTALGILPPKVDSAVYALPDALRLVPLVEQMQAGEELTPEVIRPYRKPIKRSSFELSLADKAAAAAGALGVGIPIRRAINRRIEQEFPERAIEAIDQAREAIASIEPQVDFLASFENPKEQFVNELNSLAERTTTAINQQRDIRIQNGILPEAERETPKGLAGFFVKATRKIRSFFGFLKRNQPATVNPEITAYDAGAGIQETLHSLTADQAASEENFPMLSRLILERLPDSLPITKDRLAFAAPEVLNFLLSTSPDKSKTQNLIDSVIRNPHEMRFVTHFKKHYKNHSLARIQRASHRLMPAIRDILPEEGAKVREIFDQTQYLLREPENRPVKEPAPVEAPKKGLRNRVKRLLRRQKN